MALATRTRIAGVLALSLLLLSSFAATSALASGPMPDAMIKTASGSYVGNNLHNFNALNQAVTDTGAVNEKLTFVISIGNDGFGLDSYKVSRSAGFQNGYRVRYYNASGTDVTGKVNSGTFKTPSLNTGQEYVMTATVKVRSLATTCSSVTRLITVKSVTYNGQGDAVRFTAALDSAGNCPPIARDDSNSVQEDGPNPVGGNVLANDTDADGDILSVTSVGTFTLSYGGLVLNADGTYTYTLNNTNFLVDNLNTNETLPDSFTYAISDGNGGVDSAQLHITIHGSSDPCLASGC